MSRVSARDFYHQFIAPEESGCNYSQNHHAHLFEQGSILRKTLGNKEVDRLQKHIADFKPNLSNDLLLEQMIEEIIKCNSEDIQFLLKRTFVAKRNTFFANATALPSSSVCDGHLIFFYVGLSDAAFQYAALFHEFTQIIERVNERDYQAPHRFNESLNRVATAQQRWRADGGFIQLTPGDQLDPAETRDRQRSTDFAMCTDRFILAHEIAHHLLGHSDVSAQALNALNQSDHYLLAESATYSEAWRNELSADSVAIKLLLGNSSSSEERMFATVALGALLTLTLFGQLQSDAYTGTESHPPPVTRYRNALLTLESVNATEAKKIHKVMVEFQSVLYRSMGTGLGKNKIEFPTS